MRDVEVEVVTSSLRMACESYKQGDRFYIQEGRTLKRMLKMRWVVIVNKPETPEQGESE